MTKIARQALSAVAVAACAMGVSAPANAVFVARICNDLQCLGGDDVIVQDNSGGDSIGMTGAISFATSAFGYTLEVNTSQSKPVIGSATAPQLDLSFVVTGAGAGNVFLYASDTDFLTGGQFTLTLGGTNSGGSGSVQGRAWAARATRSSSSPARTCSARSVRSRPPRSPQPHRTCSRPPRARTR